MRQRDNTRQNASVAGRGLGAGVIALLVALGRQVDDVARFAGRHADELGRGAFQQADGLPRVTLSNSDDLLRGVDDVAASASVCGRCLLDPPFAPDQA